MEKNITLKSSDIRVLNAKTCQSAAVLNAIKKTATAPLEWLRQYYSSVLERNVTQGETVRYLHAQLAFVVAVFATYDSLLVHMAAMAWAAWALLRCND